MIFDVTVQRTEYREHTFRVEAKNKGEAWEKGMDAAEDWDFHDSPVDSAGEEIIAILPISGTP